MKREQMVKDFRAILNDCGQQVVLNSTELLAVVKDCGTEPLDAEDDRSGIGGCAAVMELRLLWDEFPHRPRINSDLTIDGELWTVAASWKLCMGTQLKLRVYQEQM